MKNVLVNYGGVILFYLIIFLGVLFLCANNKPVNVKPSSFSTAIGYVQND